MSVEIIAEIANAHQGKHKIAIDIAKKAIEADADAIKFQVYFANEFLVNHHPRYRHFKKQAFSINEWKEIFRECKNNKIKIYCDVFGLKAFELVQKYQIDGIKVHSSDLNNYHLLQACNQFKKKIFLSCGGSTINEINYAIKILRDKKPILLHGFQSYPTKAEDSNLSRIAFLKKIFGNKCEYGYQDHISGSDQLSTILPIVSMKYGIKYIEKHITINRSQKGVDYYSSVEPKSFKRFVSTIRLIEKTHNTNPLNYSEAELNYRKEVKKFWVASSNLKKGKKILKKDLIMKRVDNKLLHPLTIEELLGKKINKNIKKDEALNNAMIEKKVCALILVRSESKRLPGKAYLKINDEPIIEHLIKRVKKIKLADKIILCTTSKKSDDKLEEIAKKNKIFFYRGDNKNVLKRMIGAVKDFKFDILLRITGDDILIDPTHANIAINHHLITNSEYTDHKKLPGGTEIEIFNYKLLLNINKSINDHNNTEYLTNFIVDNKSQFNISSAPLDSKYYNNLNLTIDTKEEFLLVKNFLEEMKKKNKLMNYHLSDILKFFKIKTNYRKKPKAKLKLSIDTKIEWNKFI